MSKESAREFMQKMLTDRSFAEEVEKLEGAEERAAFVRRLGYDFGRKELTEAAMELNEANVSGGRCCTMTCESEPHPCSNDRFSTSYCRLQAG